MQDPLVFIPGLMCDARVFSHQITAFSPFASVTVTPATGGDRIEDIASRLLDDLPWRFALVGLGMGGSIAMELLRRAPDRISRLALINTSSLAETPQSAAEYEPAIIKLKADQMQAAVDVMIRPDSLAPGNGRAQVQALLYNMAAHLGTDTLIRQIRALQRRRDYQAVLRRCAVPSLVMCGIHDHLAPVKRHGLMAELIPDAQLVTFDEAGHLPVLESPDQINAALFAWLSQTPT